MDERLELVKRRAAARANFEQLEEEYALRLAGLSLVLKEMTDKPWAKLEQGYVAELWEAFQTNRSAEEARLARELARTGAGPRKRNYEKARRM